MDGTSREKTQTKLRLSRSDVLADLLQRADKLVRSWYGDSSGRIPALNAQLMQEDLTAITIAHLSNYVPGVMPELKETAKLLVARMLDLEIAHREDS